MLNQNSTPSCTVRIADNRHDITSTRANGSATSVKPHNMDRHQSTPATMRKTRQPKSSTHSHTLQASHAQKRSNRARNKPRKHKTTRKHYIFFQKLENFYPPVQQFSSPPWVGFQVQIWASGYGEFDSAAHNQDEVGASPSLGL